MSFHAMTLRGWLCGFVMCPSWLDIHYGHSGVMACVHSFCCCGMCPSWLDTHYGQSGVMACVHSFCCCGMFCGQVLLTAVVCLLHVNCSLDVVLCFQFHKWL